MCIDAGQSRARAAAPLETSLIETARRANNYERKELDRPVSHVHIETGKQMNRTDMIGACGLLLVGLLACKEDKAETKAEAPVSTPVAAPTTPEAPAATAEPTADNTEQKITFKLEDVPDIPGVRSNPPQGTEWDSAPLVNTQGANARADRCSMRVLREWLRIYCTGDVIGYEKMEDFGSLQNDYYMKISPGKFASFVIRLRKGKNPKIRVCRTKDRASLFVSWPPSVDKPKHVALGKGPACDGSDWGVGYGKAGQGTAAKGPLGDPGAGDNDEYDRMRKQALIACNGGNEYACAFYCGNKTCK